MIATPGLVEVIEQCVKFLAKSGCKYTSLRQLNNAQLTFNSCEDLYEIF